MKQLIIASRNSGKISEIRGILSGLPLELLSLRDLKGLPDIIEDGATLQENALKKARGIFSLTQTACLADDTGLEVFALEMRPGVFSARYAGEDATYDDNNRKLLGEMRGFTGKERAARFRCVAAFLDERTEKLTEGICLGRIGQALAGAGGFGYDPLFIPDGFDETFAELTTDVKNTISHRAMAFRAMRSFLAAITGHHS